MLCAVLRKSPRVCGRITKRVSRPDSTASHSLSHLLLQNPERLSWLPMNHTGRLRHPTGPGWTSIILAHICVTASSLARSGWHNHPPLNHSALYSARRCPLGRSGMCWVCREAAGSWFRLAQRLSRVGQDKVMVAGRQLTRKMCYDCVVSQPLLLSLLLSPRLGYEDGSW